MFGIRRNQTQVLSWVREVKIFVDSSSEYIPVLYSTGLLADLEMQEISVKTGDYNLSVFEVSYEDEQLYLFRKLKYS